jgi:Flp pilus assembly protein TadG
MTSLVRLVTSLLRSDRGNVAMIFAITLVPLILAGGAGVDLARYEAIRVEMQDGLDRGVLAAASLSQKQKTADVLKSYMNNLSYGKDVVIDFSEATALNSRKISATASYSIGTAFMHLAGVKTLTINTASSAEEAKQNIELSLMLDMSGSMVGSKIKNLKVASQQFIDQILTDDTKDYTTISVVPYAGHVNVGAAVFDKLNGKRLTAQSQPTNDPTYKNSCFELDSSSYGSDTIPAFKDRSNLPIFTHWNYKTTDKEKRWWWCPGEEDAITYFSNDATYLKARLGSLQLYDGTGTQNAVQWGYMLLNPASSAIVQAAIASGQMSSKFSNRPTKFGDADTMKVLVLMTDGAITQQFRPNDYSRSPDLSPSNYTVSGNTATYLNNICTTAKAKGITIFTIGFELGGDTAAINGMKNCATSSAHFYQASGSGIGDAFKSISTSIRKLRLTQ